MNRYIYLYILALIVVAVLTAFLLVSYKTGVATKEELTAVTSRLVECQEILRVTNEELNNEKAVVKQLQEELSVANEVASAIDSEKWAVDTTVTEKEIQMLAKTVWGEARGCNKLEQSAVVWCILNRVDAGRGTIAQVITAPGQFHGYKKNFPVTDEIRALVEDVVARWKLEKVICGDVGRTLPKDYLYFVADSTGIGNVFRNAYKGPCDRWDWNCWNPYE